MTKTFADYWRTEVEPLANNCCKDYGLVRQLEQATTTDQKTNLEQQMAATGIKDWEAVERISELLWFVKHNQYSPHCGSLSRISDIKRVLTSQDFYDDTFQEQPDCEEARNYRALGQKLTEALPLLLELSRKERELRSRKKNDSKYDYRKRAHSRD